jgi:hypothetical protein
VLLFEDPLASPTRTSLPLLNTHLLQLIQHRLVKLTRGPVPREDLVRPRLFENLPHESEVTNLGLPCTGNRVEELFGEVFDDTAMRRLRYQRSGISSSP